MNPETEPYCLVLGGGGTKGVYHIGVWQALTELKIPVNAFIGNSIGAVVSAFLVQGAQAQLLEIAKSIQLKSLVRLHKDQALADERSFSLHSLNYWQGVYKNIVDKGGLDTSPLRQLLENTIDETLIRKNGFDFGITTVNVSDFKSREVFIEEMEAGQLINYVMASAAFPGFENPTIEGKKYIDGGLYDNMPYAMAKKRGYRKIILVDVSGMGLNRRAKTEGTQTVYIKNSIDMGSAFDFNPTFINKFWRLGYLDTLRAFGQLVGYQYFIVHDDQTERDFTQQLSPEDVQLLKKISPSQMQHDRRFLLVLLEICAGFLKLEPIEKYSYPTLIRCIQTKLNEIYADVEQLIQQRGLERTASSRKLFDVFIKEIMDNTKRNDSPYFYFKLIQYFEPNTATKLAETGAMKLNPELHAINIFNDYLSTPTNAE